MTQADLTSAAAQILSAVPFARSVGVRVLDVSTQDGVRAVLELPDDPALHNHVAGPHAGAQFTLGESASGAVVSPRSASTSIGPSRSPSVLISPTVSSPPER